jgi:hypothetical protein
MSFGHNKLVCLTHYQDRESRVKVRRQEGPKKLQFNVAYAEFLFGLRDICANDICAKGTELGEGEKH